MDGIVCFAIEMKSATQNWLKIVIYVTITTLVILAAGPKREYPDGGGGQLWKQE